jgi:peptide/nickel transport system permease protein
MTTYVIRRLFMAVVVLVIVTLIVFFVMRLLPGDPLVIFMGRAAGTGTMSPEQLEYLRVQYGLDKPLMLQYATWMAGIFQGDLGKSIYYHEDVGRLLLERFPVTLHLGLSAYILSSVGGIVLGGLAAIRRGTWIDTLTTTLANIWLSTKQAVMPVICLAITGLAYIARQMRSSMLEVIRQDYIRTAWSKGLSERIVINKHALKNSLIPVITLLGIGIGMVFGGSVLVETVFAVPGIGRLLVTSVFAQDYVVVQSGTLVISTVIVLSNLLVDISYGWLDPRIRYG